MSEAQPQTRAEKLAAQIGSLGANGPDSTDPVTGAPVEAESQATPMEDAPVLPPEQQAQEVQEAPAQEPTLPNHGDKYVTADDLKVYAQSLEQKLKEQGERQTRVEEPEKPVEQKEPTRVADLDDDSKLEDEFWKNPVEFVKKTKEEAKKEVIELQQKEKEKQEQESKYWNDFYSSNVDLKNQDRTVKMVLNENWNRFKELSLSELKVELAKECRSYLDGVRSGTVRVEQLSSAPADTLGVSASRQQVQPQEPSKPLSFVDQMRQARRRG